MESLHEDVIPLPNKESWLRIANEFEKKWDFPHCIGAIDGKHVVIQVSIFRIYLLFQNLFIEKC